MTPQKQQLSNPAARPDLVPCHHNQQQHQSTMATQTSGVRYLWSLALLSVLLLSTAATTQAFHVAETSRRKATRSFPSSSAVKATTSSSSEEASASSCSSIAAGGRAEAATTLPPTSSTKTPLHRHSVNEEEEDDDDVEQRALIGVLELEEWLLRGNPPNTPASTMHPKVRHARFDGGRLRGLQWNDPRSLPPTGTTITVATIPASKVMRSEYPSPTWDVKLAVQLWSEYRKGAVSPYAGYLYFLTAGQPYDPTHCPASVAPHTIRHWTPTQLDRLRGFPAGLRILELHHQQDTQWRTKFEELDPTEANTMSRDQFAWAMEVVHSRAYLGASMEATTAANALPSLAAPVVVAGAGLLYASTVPEPSSAVLAALAVLAAVPLLRTVVAPSTATPQSAALLPLIDSANHRAGADSAIRFDPLQQHFELIVGPGCIDAATRQLFVSYGPKSDAELLLNYGFLPGSPSLGSTPADIGDDDAVRRQLAASLRDRSLSQ